MRLSLSIPSKNTKSPIQSLLSDEGGTDTELFNRDDYVIMVFTFPCSSLKTLMASLLFRDYY